MSMAPSPGTGSPKAGLWILGAAVVLGLAIFGGDSDDATSTDAATVAASESVDAAEAPAMEAAAPSVPTSSVDRAILRRASTHYRLATRDEGLDGAVVYSRNCYAGLKAGFSWRRLDTCGAFDAVAGARYADDASGADASWLEAETAAGRYLAAAIAAGMPPTNADVRLAALQGSARAPVRPAAVAELETEKTVDASEPDPTSGSVVEDMLEAPAEPVAVPPSGEPSLPPVADEGTPLDQG